VAVPVVDRSERNHGCTSRPWSPLAEAIAIIAIGPACSNCAAEGVDQRGRHPSLPVSDPACIATPSAREPDGTADSPLPKLTEADDGDSRPVSPAGHEGRRDRRCTAATPHPIKPRRSYRRRPLAVAAAQAEGARPEAAKMAKAVLARRLTPDTRWTQCAASGGRKPRGCRSVSLSGCHVLSLIDLAVPVQESH
jgi:hypothetical protein